MPNTLVFDPHEITDFDRKYWQLELFMLFGILVANRDADRTAVVLDRLMKFVRWKPGSSPFAALKRYYRRGKGGKEFDHGCLAVDLLALGMGQYRRKAIYVSGLLAANLGLRTCTAEDLVALKGVKWKTAKMFLIHTRRGYRGACLDTHHLRILSQSFPDARVPRDTPASADEYVRLENLALKAVDASGVGCANYDLSRWEAERNKPVGERRRDAVTVSEYVRRFLATVRCAGGG